VPSSSAVPRAALGAFAVDAALVVVFAVIGRASHERGLSVVGVAETAWPFLAGLVVGWLALRGWRAPRRIFPIALGIWLVTVAGGMLLRAASGQGTALAFVIVATVTLGVLLLGWRALALLVGAARARRDRETPVRRRDRG
jgi:hypothetical protein